MLETQIDAIPLMKSWTKPQDHYTDIATHDNVVISFSESRAVLHKISIAGEILCTPGHSNHSVSLLLDDGSVFTGDLTHPALAGEQDAKAVATGWRLLRERGATRVYIPGMALSGPCPTRSQVESHDVRASAMMPVYNARL